MTSSDRDGPGRILVVEDDLVAGRFLVHVLGGRGGFAVTHTTDPASALQRVSSQPWDLVLTDVEMPGMTGLELLKALKRIAPDLPVAVLTAHSSLDYALRALRDHADEFLQKPVPLEQLLATVGSLVDRGRAARLAARQSVLAIGAHPDDVEIGAAGALLVHHGLGHEVSILTLSRGARGGTESVRAGESEMAAMALGATLFHEDLQDTRIGEGDQTISAISRVVEDVAPTVIYTHSLHDVHQDHRNTHQAAMVAVRKVGRVYCFQSPSATVDFRPTRFVTIDDQLERKLLAIQAFASQATIRAYLKPDLIESTARYWSRYGDGLYAEAFEVIRDAAATGLPGRPAAGQDPVAAARELIAAPGGAARPAAGPPEPVDATRSHPEGPHATP